MRTMEEISDDALFFGELLKSRREFVRVLHREEDIITNQHGRATNDLMVLSGTDNTMTAVSSVLKAMEKDGWIEREIRGKRTFAIALNPENSVVSRLIGFFEENIEVVEEVEEEETPETPEPQNTSILDAASLADELLLRIVDILNSPTSEDLHHRLGEQTEYANTMRNRCGKLEDEIKSLKTTVEAKDARIASLNREKTQLETNLRAALKQERSVVGTGMRALERFMQEIPKGRG